MINKMIFRQSIFHDSPLSSLIILTPIKFLLLKSESEEAYR